MLNRLLIDGIDCFDNFGVFVAKDGYAGLVNYPSLKKIESNDWKEEDGIEPDLLTTALSSNEFSIKFCATGVADTGGFFDLITDLSYHVFEFLTINKSYKLRLISQPNYSHYRELEIFTLQFVDDFPLDAYNYLAPESNYFKPSEWLLDDVDFNKYGCTVLRESISSILQSSPVKKHLTIDANKANGVKYYNGDVTFQQKDAKINLLMRAYNLTEFWRNYNALIYNLSKAGERSLFVPETGLEYSCYYKSCQTSKFSTINKIWFQFSLNLCFTSFRFEHNLTLLSTEDNALVTTEDNRFIDLKPI